MAREDAKAPYDRQPGDPLRGYVQTTRAKASVDAIYDDLGDTDTLTKAHAARHAAGGADPVTPAAIGAAPATRNVDTDEATLTGGGDLSADRTLSIKDGGVTGPKIAVGAVDSSHLATGTIVDGDVSASANIARTKIAISRQTFSNANVTVSTTAEVVAQTGTMTAPRTVTLPAASAVPAGWEVSVQDESGTASSTNTITIARAGTDTINGATSVVIGGAYGWRRLRSNGVNGWTFDGGVLRSSLNLADVADAATARTNIGAAAAIDAAGNLLPDNYANLTGGFALYQMTAAYASNQLTLTATATSTGCAYNSLAFSTVAGNKYTFAVDLVTASARDWRISVQWRNGGVNVGGTVNTQWMPAGSTGTLIEALTAPAGTDGCLINLYSGAGSIGDTVTFARFGMWRGVGGTYQAPGKAIVGLLGVGLQTPIASAGVPLNRATPVVVPTASGNQYLPLAADNAGVKFTVVNTGVGAITIYRTSPDTVDGLASVQLPDKGSVEIVSDGSTWRVIAGRYESNAAGKATYLWSPDMGWRLVAYDTGWRDVSADATANTGQTITVFNIRRTLHLVHVEWGVAETATVNRQSIYTLPVGFRPRRGTYVRAVVDSDASSADVNFYAASGGDFQYGQTGSASRRDTAILWTPATTLPSSLPGTTVTNPA